MNLGAILVSLAMTIRLGILRDTESLFHTWRKINIYANNI